MSYTVLSCACHQQCHLCAHPSYSITLRCHGAFLYLASLPFSLIERRHISLITLPSARHQILLLYHFVLPRSQLSGPQMAKPGRPGKPAVVSAAGLAVKEPSTGVEFPLVRTFWVGEAQRNIGAGVRQKKFAFVGVKVPSCSPPVKESPFATHCFRLP